jgi:hypothetical protein
MFLRAHTAGHDNLNLAWTSRKEAFPRSQAVAMSHDSHNFRGLSVHRGRVKTAEDTVLWF